MRWQRGRGLSVDVEDRRGRPLRRGVALGGGVGIPALLITLVATLCTGGGGGNLDLSDVLGELGAAAAPAAPQDASIVDGAPQPVGEQEEFISFVLDDIQNFWDQQFREGGSNYERSTLVLYTQGTETGGCGFGQAAAGPFYCPADQKVYVDLSFFRELATRFGAPGDFAQAYVIAHEIGHHVQHITGISEQVRAQGSDNELSVRVELQADCLAGVWAHSAYGRDTLEPGDVEEGLDAAAAVGDDMIQGQAGVPVNPETWTHGSSEQRVRWFRTGFESGNPNDCDTFSGEV